MQSASRTCCWMGCCVIVAAWLAGAGCSEPETPQAPARPKRPATQPEVPSVDLTIELTGDGLATPRTFTFAELAKMEMTSLEDVLMQRSHDPDIKTNWRGPRLAELLRMAGLKPGAMVVKIEASDGYSKKAGSDVWESALIALQDGEGKWLAESEPGCPIRLVAPKATADYWVANVRRIVVSPRGE